MSSDQEKPHPVKLGRKSLSLKVEITVDFHRGHDDRQDLFVNIDSSSLVGHQLPPGQERHPIICSNMHAPDQTLTRPRLIHDGISSEANYDWS